MRIERRLQHRPRFTKPPSWHSLAFSELFFFFFPESVIAIDSKRFLGEAEINTCNVAQCHRMSMSKSLPLLRDGQIFLHCNDCHAPRNVKRFVFLVFIINIIITQWPQLTTLSKSQRYNRCYAFQLSHLNNISNDYYFMAPTYSYIQSVSKFIKIPGFTTSRYMLSPSEYLLQTTCLRLARVFSWGYLWRHFTPLFPQAGEDVSLWLKCRYGAIWWHGTRSIVLFASQQVPDFGMSRGSSKHPQGPSQTVPDCVPTKNDDSEHSLVALLERTCDALIVLVRGFNYTTLFDVCIWRNFDGLKTRKGKSLCWQAVPDIR